MCITIYKASYEEQHRDMAADFIVANPIYKETRAITINAPVERIWPWLAQMGSDRGGWYAYDWIDNSNHPSAKTILPEYQNVAPGDIMPALPGMKDIFLITAVDPPYNLILTVPDPKFGSRVSWEFHLETVDQGQSRLIVRGRVSPHWLDTVNENSPATQQQPIFIERVYSLLSRIPRPVMITIASFGHGLMEARQLGGIKRRAES
jgi:hypothetical protein